MAKTKSDSCEFVKNKWSDVFIVITTETFFNGQQLHLLSTNDDGKKFIVVNVLPLRNDNAPCLLVDALVVPVRIQIAQFRRDSIVFTQNHSLRDDHVRRYIHSIVTYRIVLFSFKNKIILTEFSMRNCLFISPALKHLTSGGGSIPVTALDKAQLEI